MPNEHKYWYSINATSYTSERLKKISGSFALAILQSYGKSPTSLIFQILVAYLNVSQVFRFWPSLIFLYIWCHTSHFSHINLKYRNSNQTLNINVQIWDRWSGICCQVCYLGLFILVAIHCIAFVTDFQQWEQPSEWSPNTSSNCKPVLWCTCWTRGLGSGLLGDTSPRQYCVLHFPSLNIIWIIVQDIKERCKWWLPPIFLLIRTCGSVVVSDQA